MGELKYSEEDFDRILQKRLKEQAEAVKVAGIDKAITALSRKVSLLDRRLEIGLREANRRLDNSNHLKETLLSKDDAIFLFKDVIRRDDLNDGDFWIHHGPPQPFNPEEAKILRGFAQHEVDKRKFWKTINGRITIIAGTSLALFAAIQTYIMYDNLELQQHLSALIAKGH